MHQFRSHSAIWRLRFAALLICVKCILVPVCVGVVSYSLARHDNNLTHIGLALVLLTALIVLLQWMLSNRTGCPLCMTPVMAARGCAKHRHAKTLLGSHRLSVAIAVLFRGWFRCPYCNEPTELKVRDRRNR